jgi:hypothetical protein
MECSDGSEVSSRVYGGREDGVMGSLAAGRVAQGDWARFWQAIIIDLSSGSPAWWDSSGCPASLAVDIDAPGTRRDIQRHCGTSIGTIDGTIAGPLGLDCDLRTSI